MTEREITRNAVPYGGPSLSTTMEFTYGNGRKMKTTGFRRSVSKLIEKGLLVRHTEDKYGIHVLSGSWSFSYVKMSHYSRRIFNNLTFNIFRYMLTGKGRAMAQKLKNERRTDEDDEDIHKKWMSCIDDCAPLSNVSRCNNFLIYIFAQVDIDIAAQPFRHVPCEGAWPALDICRHRRRPTKARTAINASLQESRICRGSEKDVSISFRLIIFQIQYHIWNRFCMCKNNILLWKEEDAIAMAIFREA